MPLTPGTSHQTVSSNISEMMHAGHPQNQAVAAALREARSSRRKHADTGRALPLQGAPGAGAEEHIYAGPLHSTVPGRTDKINLNVAPGSYVIPADVTSIIGEGNTLAGTSVLKAWFGPEGHLAGNVKPPQASHSAEGKLPHVRASRLMEMAGKPLPGPHMSAIEQPQQHQDGGDTDPGDDSDPETQGTAPVVVAGGEYILSPQTIIKRYGDLTKGHRALDHVVKIIRQREIERLKNAPPPKK